MPFIKNYKVANFPGYFKVEFSLKTEKLHASYVAPRGQPTDYFAFSVEPTTDYAVLTERIERAASKAMAERQFSGQFIGYSFCTTAHQKPPKIEKKSWFDRDPPNYRTVSPGVTLQFAWVVLNRYTIPGAPRDEDDLYEIIRGSPGYKPRMKDAAKEKTYGEVVVNGQILQGWRFLLGDTHEGALLLLPYDERLEALFTYVEGQLAALIQQLHDKLNQYQPDLPSLLAALTPQNLLPSAT